MFSVAVAGQQKDDTEWLECCFFGERARKVAPFLGKGSQVMVSGLLKKEIFTRKNGQTACQLKVLVRGLEFCGQAKKEERAQPQAPAVAQNYSAASINDLPF